MYILSTKEMKEVERVAIEDKGIPSLLLMENAAKGATEIILEQNPKRVIIFAGKGNNGGDGLAIGRMLITNNINTKIVFIGEKEKATPDCLKNLEILENYNADIDYSSDNIEISQYDLVVDALIGTGLTRELNKQYIELVQLINKGNFIVSVDCPTGVNSDTGKIYNVAVSANITVTFHLPKIGLLLYPGYSYIGKLIIKNIGAPYIDNHNTFVLNKPYNLLPKRHKDSNKGTYGKVMFISGCDTMAGAAVINATSAYMTGCGLVNICSTPHVIDVIHNKLPEAITTYRERLDLNYGNVIAIGSGLGISLESKVLVEYTLKNTKVPVIADADALNIVSEKPRLKNLTTVITPHLKEMSNLTGFTIEYIKNNLIDVAKDYAYKYNTVVVLKDSHSVIASPEGKICINITGTPAMSKGGSGDSLTGVIAGLMAQGLNAFDASCLGAYINGKAGEIAENETSPYSVIARDISKSIPQAINDILQN